MDPIPLESLGCMGTEPNAATALNGCPATNDLPKCCSRVAIILLNLYLIQPSMTSPLTTNNKQNSICNQDTFDCSISFEHKPPPFKKKRVPGKLTIKQSSLPPTQLLDELILLKQNQNLTNSQLFNEFEDIVNSLLHKNDALIAQNALLKKQNSKFKNEIKLLEEQLRFMRNSPHANPDGFSIMNYFNTIGAVPIVEPIDGNPYELLERNICACKNDTNSNLRAFYLSMLQHRQTRKLLNQLISHYESDDSWKLVPLLSTNESWVQLSVNFFKVLDSSQFEEIQQIYSFINESELYDIIFVSALRSRVQFLAEGYDSQIDSMQLYTALCNIFGNEKISFNRNLHVKYDTYNFEVGEIAFTIYFIEDINQYAVSFYQPERMFSSVQSYNASTPPQKSMVEKQGSQSSEFMSSSSILLKYCPNDEQ